MGHFQLLAGAGDGRLIQHQVGPLFTRLDVGLDLQSDEIVVDAKQLAAPVVPPQNARDFDELGSGFLRDASWPTTCSNSAIRFRKLMVLPLHVGQPVFQQHRGPQLVGHLQDGAGGPQPDHLTFGV